MSWTFHQPRRRARLLYNLESVSWEVINNHFSSASWNSISVISESVPMPSVTQPNMQRKRRSLEQLFEPFISLSHVFRFTNWLKKILLAIASWKWVALNQRVENVKEKMITIPSSSNLRATVASPVHQMSRKHTRAASRLCFVSTCRFVSVCCSWIWKCVTWHEKRDELEPCLLQKTRKSAYLR